MPEPAIETYPSSRARSDAIRQTASPRAQVAAALKRARRRHVPGKTDAILAALRGGHRWDGGSPVA